MKSTVTKDVIIEKADFLFRTNGYDETGMRDIAKMCGISVSNVQYYFPKKSMIMAAAYNLTLNNYFEAQMQDVQDSIKPIVKIIAAEYEFMICALSNEATCKSYLTSLSLSETCTVYADKSTELFWAERVFKDVSKSQIYNANLIMFGGLNQLIRFYYSHTSEYVFDEIVKPVFQARLLLLGINEPDSIIKEAFQYGKKLAKKKNKIKEEFLYD